MFLSDDREEEAKEESSREADQGKPLSVRGDLREKILLMCTGRVAGMSVHLNSVLVCVTGEEPTTRLTSFWHTGERGIKTMRKYEFLAVIIAVLMAHRQ